jgi:hypothetical protein
VLDGHFSTAGATGLCIDSRVDTSDVACYFRRGLGSRPL